MNSIFSTHPNRRQFTALATSAAAFMGLPAKAEEAKYPSKTITLVVPFPAGGSVDIAGRAIGERLSSA